MYPKSLHASLNCQIFAYIYIYIYCFLPYMTFSILKSFSFFSLNYQATKDRKYQIEMILSLSNFCRKQQ